MYTNAYRGSGLPRQLTADQVAETVGVAGVEGDGEAGELAAEVAQDGAGARVGYSTSLSHHSRRGSFLGGTNEARSLTEHRRLAASLREAEERALQVSIEEGRLRQRRIERQGRGAMVFGVLF